MPILQVGTHRVSCEGLLFDKDGTLLDFMTLWGDWADSVLDRMEERLTLIGAEYTGGKRFVLGTVHDEKGKLYNYDTKGPLAMATKEETIGILAWQLYHAGVPWNEATMQASDICKNAMEDVRQRKPAHPMPGLLNFLLDCRDSSLKIGVVTSDDTSSAMEQLCWMGLSDFFQVIIGRDQVSQSKPHPEMVEKAGAMLELRPEQMVLIGDSNGDMQMAKNAGIRLAIGITTRCDGADYLIDADVLIASYDEIQLK
ncbi:phosphoglycolate phosphatase [Paenibacillus sp. DS2015]|uniref:HAD family hydrolase n=1 Tax=Paenibacillus sp. DS2015 TaxID=3373917 RepID=UPI003D2388F3